MTSVCDRNCFACPYPDCICDELTLEDYRAEKEIDLLSGARVLKTSPKVAAYQKQYYEANKEKVAAYQKQYREANKEKVAAQRKQYYEANKEKVAAYQKQYREANKEKVAAYQKQYREANKEKVAAQRKQYREANKEKVAAQQKQWYEANKEKVAAQQKQWYEANKEKVAAQRKQYREANKQRKKDANGKKKIARLNKKTAQKLVKRVLGISGAGLTKEETGNGADIYHMTMGELKIKVENDWFGQTDRFILSISAPMSACDPMRLYFHPDTLEEDQAAEEAWKEEEK